MVDLNGTQAAIRAGYSQNTANEQASQNLAKLNIQERVAELQKEISERNKITVDECVGMLATMARFDIANIYDEEGNAKDIHSIDADTRMAIESLDSEEMVIDGMKIGETKKIKMSSRRLNIIELMKHLGGYEKDNSQKDSGNVVIYNIPDNGRS